MSQFQYASERAHWEAWERGETRCPYCVGLDDLDFETCCDCARFNWEKTGQPTYFSVVGTDVSVQVRPTSYQERKP